MSAEISPKEAESIIRITPTLPGPVPSIVVAIMLVATSLCAAGADAERVSQPNKVPNLDNFKTPYIKPGDSDEMEFTVTNRYQVPITNVNLELEIYLRSTLKEDDPVQDLKHPPRFTDVEMDGGRQIGQSYLIQSPQSVILHYDVLEQSYLRPISYIINTPPDTVLPGEGTVDVDFFGKYPLESAWYRVGTTGNWTPVFKDHGSTSYTANFTVEGLNTGDNTVYFACKDSMNNTYSPSSHDQVLVVGSSIDGEPAVGQEDLLLWTHYDTFNMWTNHTVALKIDTRKDCPDGTYLVRSRISFDYLGTTHLMMSRGHFTLEAWKSATDDADISANITGNIDLPKLNRTVNSEDVNISGIVVDTAFSVGDPFPEWGRWLLYGLAGFFAVLAVVFYAMDEYDRFPIMSSRFDDLSGRWRNIKRKRLREVAERDRARWQKKKENEEE